MATGPATIRIEVERLNGLMNLAEALLVSRHRLSRKLPKVNTLRSDLGLTHEQLDQLLAKVGPRSRSRREVVDGAAGKIDEATLAQELSEVAADARMLTGQITRQLGSFSEEAFQFTRLTPALQEEVAQARQVPLAQMWRRLERVVRDAGEGAGKAIDYVTEGGEIRLDKLVLDHVFNSLSHLVRNAVAHGIDARADRVAMGKPETGRVTVRGRAESGRIRLKVSDDGTGLKRDEILDAARRRGLIGDEEQVAESTLTDLIFAAELTTVKSADSVAGRGIGRYAVRAEIASLGGTIEVNPITGVGTPFSLSLPRSLTVDRVMLVRSGGALLALPGEVVEHIIDLNEAQWEVREGADWVVPAEGEAMLGYRVASLRGLPEVTATEAVVVRVGGNLCALTVDKVEQKRDVAVKPWAAVLEKHVCYTGAILSAEGRIFVVVDVARLVALPPLNSKPLVGSNDPGQIEANILERRNRVLVVDDSPSLRLLTTRQLEGMGWEVVAAVDGLQGMEKLRQGTFDIVITDLEMPRLNGFELLREMRADQRWQAMPVVIVTTRESVAHRSKATELGVIEYLIKPLSMGRLTSAVKSALRQCDWATEE
jgi:chemosensory pili system protein ChpA (sensor histidine kinase/response regulator)